MNISQHHGTQYQKTYSHTLLRRASSLSTPKIFLNHRDTYTAMLDHKFAIITKKQSDFGSLPNRSAIDLASYPKIDEAIKANRIMPYSNYNDMILPVNFLVRVSFMLRGVKNRQALPGVIFDYQQLPQVSMLGE